MKKTMSLILAVTLIISVAGGIFLGDIVSASEAPLPQVSGTTIVDTEPSDDISGEYVIIHNAGSSAQSTGALNSIQNVNSAYSRNAMSENNSTYVDDNGKIDFAMPFTAEFATDSIAIFSKKRSENFAKNTIKEVKVRNPITNAFSSKIFKLQSQGIHCNVWIPSTPEISNGREVVITESETNQIASEFDSAYNTMTDAFGAPLYPSGTNMINIMLYDIQDGNNPSAYIAGFYDPVDFSANSLAMLHIDTYPAIYRPNGAVRVENCYSTLVHEFQHLINDSQRVASGLTEMDTWLNEALSMAAEEMVYEGSAVPMRLNTYLYDPSESITRGKQLTAFDNSLESYALSCLFSAYLKEQTGSARVFEKIIDKYYSSGNVEDAITSSLDGSALSGLNFDDVLAAYKIALTVNDTNGIYGFKDNPMLSPLRPLIYYGNPVNLKSDGMIVVKTNTGKFKPSGNGTDIRFIGIGEFTGAPIISNIPNDLVVGEQHLLSGTGDGTLEWSSADSGIASIDSDGNLTANAVGSVMISLSNNIATDSVSIVVKEPYVKIKDSKTQVMESLSLQLSADIRPAGAVAWSSGDTSIATVSSDGLVTAVSQGTVIITAENQQLGLSDTFELEITEKHGLPGLVEDSANNHIDVVESIGMETLAAIVNETDYQSHGFPAGLEGWKIDLTTPVTLINHTPIGTGTKPFKGTFNGNNQGIVFESALVVTNYVGVFGVNAGKISNVSVIVTGTIGSFAVSNVGSVCGKNAGIIKDSQVSITDVGKIHALTRAGGVVGENAKDLINSTITIYGEIASDGSPAGGVAGFSQGDCDTLYATLDTATVFNYGTISSDDDVGAVVGHNQTWFDRYTCLQDHHGKMCGAFNVTIGASGSIYCNDPSSRTASVGGVVGLSGGVFGSIPNTKVTIRIDGDIATTLGYSGGVAGQGGFSYPADDFTVAVTLGPNSSITNTNAEKNGLILSYNPGDTISQHIVYAAPYNSNYYAYPVTLDAPGKNQKVKRIEYPNSIIPSPAIEVDENGVPVLSANNSSSTPDGIFKKLSTLASGSLKIDSAVDADIFTVGTDENTQAQTIHSTYKIDPNYYDFNMIADGISIVVPAYLSIPTGETPPEMTLEILGNKLHDSMGDAKADTADGSQSITISATNGRIADWTITKDDVDYKKSISNASLTSDTLKSFSVAERGLYKITATGTPFDGSEQQDKFAYICIGGIPNITLSGDLLISSPDESVWTNLATPSQVRIQTAENTDDDRFTLATVKTVQTTIKDIEITKDSVPFKLDNQYDYLTAPTIDDTERTFKLYETGRYKISAKGIDISEPAVKYVNIDVDKPPQPILKLNEFTENSTSIEFSLVEENRNQSSSFAEYSLNDGDFVRALNGVIPIGIGTTKIRTRDMASNVSDEIVIERKEINVTLEADPPAGGIVEGTTKKSVIILKQPNLADIEFKAQATIKAEAKDGYEFVEWTSEDLISPLSTQESTIVTIKDIHLIAHFEPEPPAPSEPEPPAPSEPEPPAPSEPEPPVSSNPEPPVSSKPTSADQPRGDYIKLDYTADMGGKITGEAEQWIKRYSDGTTVTAIPSDGYRFIKWSDGNTNPDRHDTAVFNDLSVTAWFEQIPVYNAPSVIKPVEVPKTGAKNPTPYILAIASLALGVLGYSIYRFRKTEFKK